MVAASGLHISETKKQDDRWSNRMKIDFNDLNRHWLESMSVKSNEENRRIIPPEYACCQELMEIRRTVTAVLATKEELFREPDRIRKGRRGVVATRVGRKLEASLLIDLEEIHNKFPHHRFDPYFTLFESTYRATRLGRGNYTPSPLMLNEFVETLRVGAKEVKFRKMLRNHERAALSNATSVSLFFDKMYHDYSKILHVRLEASYRKVPGREELSAQRMKSDREKLMRYVRKKFKKKFIGHMWTVEFGDWKGPHFHIILSFDGSHLREGITIGTLIGEHWKVITGGEGTYYNVNRDEDAYERRGLRGIGLIAHSDGTRRHNLLVTGLYLVKTDLFVRLVMPGFVKTFGHARYRPRKKSKAGRKRKIQGLIDRIESIVSSRGGTKRKPEEATKDAASSVVPVSQEKKGKARKSPFALSPDGRIRLEGRD